MNEQHYTDTFYSERHNNTIKAAKAVIKTVMKILPTINSVVDFGCGVGSWLYVFKNHHNIPEIIGLDGDWVPNKQLVIDKNEFIETNMENTVNLNKRFDLAISLEVAEHISQKNASIFVKNIITHSDMIIFSAAIPFQGGSNHINEQWQSYWSDMFEAYGYRAIDIIKPAIWNNDEIPYYYKQNIVLYVNKEAEHRLNIPTMCMEWFPNNAINMVHPELFLRTQLEVHTIKGSFKFFRRAVKKQIKSLIIKK